MNEEAPVNQPHADHPTHPPADEPPPGARRRRWWPWLLIVAAAGLAAYVFLPGSGGAEKKKSAALAAAANAPTPVVAATARIGSIPIYLTGLGSVTALNTAVVKSRVDGQLLRINFVEGQLVREGFPLAELDPRPFQVQLMQAEGQKAKDEATLENDKVDLQRYQILMQQDSIPKQQLDTQVATVKQAEATVQSDQAQVESAKLNLIYCKITAPITGRVGLRQVDVGNIVHATDTTGIVVLNEVQPITVIFTLPADRLPQVLQQVHAGRKLQVEAFDRDMKNRLAIGALFAIDNQIDPTTGTVRLRAQFANQDDSLFPSQFVNARVLVDTIQNAVIVPTAAIQRSPQATFVYVVDPGKHTVSTQNVDLQLTEGDMTAVRHGLAAGDVVVTDGVDRLRPGAKVTETMAPNGAGANPANPANAANGSGTANGTASGHAPGGAKPAAPAPPPNPRAAE
jgi:multidrug efflux system membrane fusion protein